MAEKKFTNKEKTLIIIKPESIQRHIIGELISKFEKRGLKLIGCKLVAPTADQVAKHYPDDKEWYVSSGTKTWQNYKDRGIDPPGSPIELAKRTRKRLIDHLSNRPLLLMVWGGAARNRFGPKNSQRH